MTGILEIKTFYRNSHLLERVSTPRIRAKSSIPFQPYPLVGVLILISNQYFPIYNLVRRIYRILCRNPNRLYCRKFYATVPKNVYPAIGTKRTWVLNSRKNFVIIAKLWVRPTQNAEIRNFGWWTPFLRNINFGKKFLLYFNMSIFRGCKF